MANEPATVKKPHLDLGVIFGDPEVNLHQVASIEHLRGECAFLAQGMQNLVPDGPEQALAIRQIEQAFFYARAAIERYGVKQV